MATREEIINIDETTEIIFKDEASKNEWEKIVEENSHDIYGEGMVSYARRWAKYMQILIEKGKNVDDIAKQASYAADIEGITVYMYILAIKNISKVWKYGEELKIWHNKKYGYEGDGIVNPSELTVKVG